MQSGVTGRQATISFEWPGQPFQSTLTTVILLSWPGLLSGWMWEANITGILMWMELPIVPTATFCVRLCIPRWQCVYLVVEEISSVCRYREARV
jgi:hypothetical protein